MEVRTRRLEDGGVLLQNDPQTLFIQTLIIGVRTRGWRSLLQNDLQAILYTHWPWRSGPGGWRMAVSFCTTTHKPFYIHTDHVGQDPEVGGWRCSAAKQFIVALRPQRPYTLLGTGSPGRPPRPFTQLLNSWSCKKIHKPFYTYTDHQARTKR